MNKFSVKLVNDDNSLENIIEFSSMDDISKYLQYKRDEHISKLILNKEEVL
jgi:hypothetical protein